MPNRPFHSKVSVDTTTYNEHTMKGEHPFPSEAVPTDIRREDCAELSQRIVAPSPTKLVGQLGGWYDAKPTMSLNN